MATSCSLFMLMIVFILTVNSVTTRDIQEKQTYQRIMENAANVISRRPTLEQKPWEQLSTPQDDEAFQQLHKLQDTMLAYRRGRMENSTVKEVLSSRLGALLEESYNVSDVCLNETMSILQGVLGQQIWALMIIDTFGKLPSGIFTGNVMSIGNYDECLEMKGYSVQGAFDLNTCFISPTILSIPINLGICVPSSCSGQEVQTIISAGLSMLDPELDTPIPVVSCRDEDGPEIDGRAIGCIIVCGIIALCIVTGSTFDVYNTHFVGNEGNGIASETEKAPLIDNVKPNNGEQGTLAKVLLAFSFYTNGKKLLSTNQPSGALTAVNGVRFLSISWVILGHTYGYVTQTTENMAFFYPKMLDRWTFQAVSNAFLSVDSFFTLSGLLLTYLFMKEMSKTESVRKFNWGMFYFHRFWRLTPPYMLVLFIDVALSRYFGNGPAWPRDGFEQDFCKDTWWTNLLYINNFVKSEKMCMGWSWYLANDMQFFVISPLMLIPLALSPLIGIGTCLVFLLGSWITTGVLSSHYKLIASQMAIGTTLKEQNEYFQKYYITPYCRIGPYIIGMITGYILYRTEKGFRMNKILNVLAWAIAAALACTVLYGLYDSTSSGDRLSVEVAALYNTTHRTVWAASLCWVIFACARGYGGFVNTLLSWKGFIPLSRLTYCAYLVHPIVMSIVNFSRRRYYYMTDITMIHIFLGNMVAAFAFAFFTSLAFESPMMGLEKALLHKNKRK